MNPFSNKFLIGATVLVIGLHMAAVYTAVGQAILRTTPLSLAEWGIILAVASSIIVVEEIRKFIFRRRNRD